MMKDEPEAYKTSEEVLAVVRKFETCVFAPGEFHHREHLTVALCYLMDSDGQAALQRLRANLFRFLSHHRIQENIYHETITLFWLRRVGHFLEQADKDIPLSETANQVISLCGEAKIIFAYYTKDLLESQRARTSWVEPNIKQLDF